MLDQEAIFKEGLLALSNYPGLFNSFMQHIQQHEYKNKSVAWSGTVFVIVKDAAFPNRLPAVQSTSVR